jgi:hypothetical protein
MNLSRKSGTLISAVALSVLLFLGCRTRTTDNETLQPQTNLRVAPTLLQDYPGLGCRMFSTPTTGDPVGTVLDVDTDGTTIDGDRLSDLLVETNFVTLPKVTITKQQSAALGAVLNFLKYVPFKLMTSNALNSQLTMTITITNAAKESALESNIEKALNQKQVFVKRRPTAELLKKGTGGFVIAETYQATHIEFQFSRKELKSLSVDGSFDQIASIDPKHVRTNATTVSLIDDFPQYRRIFYLPKQIQRDGDGRFTLHTVGQHDLTNYIKFSDTNSSTQVIPTQIYNSGMMTTGPNSPIVIKTDVTDEKLQELATKEKQDKELAILIELREIQTKAKKLVDVQQEFIDGTMTTWTQLKKRFPFIRVVIWKNKGHYVWKVQSEEHYQWDANWDSVTAEPDFINNTVMWHIPAISFGKRGETTIRWVANEVIQEVPLNELPFMIKNAACPCIQNQPCLFVQTLSNNQMNPVFALGFHIVSKQEVKMQNFDE